MHSTCSRAMARRSSNATPWSAASSRFHPKPMPRTTRPPLRWSSVASCLARTIGIVLGDQHDPGAEEDPTGDRRRRGQGHDGVEAAAVVVERHPLDQGRRLVGPHREVGVLGQVEGVEAALLGGQGQLGRGHGQIGEECGDAEAHGRSAIQSGGELRAGVVLRGRRTSAANADSSRARASAIACRREAIINRLISRVACGANDAIRRARSMVSSSTVPAGADPEGQPGIDGLVGIDPLGGQQHGRGPLPSHPLGEQPTAGRLGRHPQLGERDPEPRRLVHQDQVHVGEQGAPQPHAHSVDRGQQRLVEGDDDIHQVPEARARLRARRRRRPGRPSRGGPGRR